MRIANNTAATKNAAAASPATSTSTTGQASRRDIVGGDGFDRSSRSAVLGMALRSAVRASASAATTGPTMIPVANARTDAIVTRLFRELLGRTATSGFWHDFARERARAGAAPEEIEASVRGHLQASDEYRALHATDDIVDTAFRDLLERDSGGAGFWHDFARMKRAEGTSLEDIDREVRTHLRASEEYRTLHATDELVDAAYRDLLERDSGGAGFWHELARTKRDEGMPLEEIDQQVRTHLRDSAEYRTLHPEGTSTGGTVGTRRAEDAFLAQPNDWTCGPTSLMMALAHHGIGDVSTARALQIARETGTEPVNGFPGNAETMAQFARNRGLQASSSPSRSVDDMRAELEQGRALIVNGTTSSGWKHFLYVAGLDADGRFIVNDPNSGGTQRWSASDLHAFTHRGSNPPGYAAVWT